MSSTPRRTLITNLNEDTFKQKLEKLQKKNNELEEAAVKKDKQISLLTSRMREYEMSEYGLAEAVNEIKDCRRIIRARDREIEILTGQINTLKLQVSELKVPDEKPQTAKLTSFLSCGKYFSEVDEKGQEKDQGVYHNKTSQCKFTSIPTQYLEDFYSTQLQNENLRLELSNVCKKAYELSSQLQNDQRTNETSFSRSPKNLTSFNNIVYSRGMHLNDFDNSLLGHSFKAVDDCYKTVLHHLQDENFEVQKILQDFGRQINILKNNQLILIRRYMILSDRESSLHKENLKLRKAVHINWRKNCDSYNVLETKDKEISAKHLTTDDKKFLKKLTQQSECICSSISCHENSRKLFSITMKLLADISLLKKLLEISHHQTQALEAVCFSQEIEMKCLRDHFTLFQAQSDEKMLLGKLALKVLQLQFSQAASIYELNKYKSNHQSLQDWYSTVKEEYEENGKRFAFLYLDAQDKVKHLCDVMKDVCLRCNEALSSYLTPDYKLL